MNHEDDTLVQHSARERLLRRLAVPEAAAYAAGKRLDVIHEPDLDLLGGGQERAARAAVSTTPRGWHAAS